MKTRESLSIPACVFLAITTTVIAQTPSSQTAASQPQQADLIDRILALPPPLPDWKEQARKRNASLPPEQRDWFEGQPPEDAAIDALLGYWRENWWRHEADATKLSDKFRWRLLEAVEQQPQDLVLVLPYLPETPDAATRVERLYKAAQQSGKDDAEWLKCVHAWLAGHNENYRAELIALARDARDKGSWIDGEESLVALAKKDWLAARPIILAHADRGRSGLAALSVTLLYQHALSSGSPDEVASLREKLKSFVIERATRRRGRALACETLMATEWEGRDEWFLSLFSDRSLSVVRSLSGDPPPLIAVVRKSPDYWIPRVSALIGSEDRAAHSAAVRGLVQFSNSDARVDALRPLLPWLSDPEWADNSGEMGRECLLVGLNHVSLPESVPGLTWIVAHDDDYRLAAAQALAFQDAKTGIPALKAVLSRELKETQRRFVIQRLLALQGFSADELLDAVEIYATASATREGKERIHQALWNHYGPSRLEMKVSVGYYASCQDKPGNDVVQKLVDRANELRKEDATLANSLWSIISGWKAKPVDAEILRRLASGKGDENSIHSALQRRESVRGHIPDQLAALCDQGGMSSGVALVLLGDAKRYPAVLQGSDEEAQRALLACARLIREPLPVPVVAELLKSKDERVSKIALMYLEREDGPAARQMILARYPGQAKILGARNAFEPDIFFQSVFDDLEADLRKAVLADDGPDEIIALLSSAHYANDSQYVIQVHGDNAELRICRDFSDDSVRQLSKKQWQDLKSFLTSQSVDDLAPMDTGLRDGVEYEYVHVTKNGGRRVYMNSPWAVGGSIYDRLVRRFKSLDDNAPSTPRRRIGRPSSSWGGSTILELSFLH